MTLISIVFTTVYVLFELPGCYLQRSTSGLPREATLNFPALARKYGYKVEERDVTTEDGYILKLFHIPGNEKKPVLLMHGVIDSADSFILRGRKSLAALLAEQGYDVWLGNVRGNKYSRRHKRLNPDIDKEFWNFTFHEMAVIDLRLIVDYILRENNVNSLSLIGHSQGNTLFYILGSVKPDYNDKINVAIALAPVCFLNNLPFPVSTIINAGPVINDWLLATNQEEFFGENSLEMQIWNNVCTRRGYRICAEIIFAIVGKDVEEFEPEFYYSLKGHYPSSTSRKDMMHFLQVATRKRFAQFDYGPEKNFEVYQSRTPPPYDLNKVTMKIALIVGRNDKIATPDNASILKDKLLNVVSYDVMEREQFNHLDFIWGKHLNKYFYPRVKQLLDKYS